MIIPGDKNQTLPRSGKGGEKAREAPRLNDLRRYVPRAVWAVVVLTLLLIPFKLIVFGYAPPDDVLRHAAKAVSGKPWADLLVLNPVYQLDHEFGWDLLLAKIHGVGANAEVLVVFSVVSLFILVGLAVLPWLRYPETWLAALALGMVTERMPWRLVLGQPDLITLAALLSLLLLWRRFGPAPPRAWMAGLMTGLVAASVYLQGAWYWWALPAAAFFCARQLRWGWVFAGCAAAGVLIGGALTGHPLAYPVQAYRLALLCVRAHESQLPIDPELQPLTGDVNGLFILGGLLLLRRLAGLNAMPFLRDPVFWLVCLCWILGFSAGRFWFNWGCPALMVLVICDLQLLLDLRVQKTDFRRLALAGGLALVTFLSITSDIDRHWTSAMIARFPLEANDPGMQGWLPEKGGIYYSADQRLFYETFYQHPQGDWRYLLGFEPAWMPAEDVQVYQSVIQNWEDPKRYEPWVKRMLLADRLAIRGDQGTPPAIPQLEWKFSASGVWFGRVPGDHLKSTPPTIRATEPLATATNPALDNGQVFPPNPAPAPKEF
jgi:hypothetical protein